MKTIFILDNNSSHQKEMTEHLVAMGFGVRLILNAAELEDVSERPFTIILDEKMMDLKMVCKKMSRAPVIYMVSKSDKKVIHDAKKAGAYEVIEKNVATFVNLRTTLDKLEIEPASNWFKRVFRMKLAITYGLS